MEKATGRGGRREKGRERKIAERRVTKRRRFRLPRDRPDRAIHAIRSVYVTPRSARRAHVRAPSIYRKFRTTGSTPTSLGSPPPALGSIAQLVKTPRDRVQYGTRSPYLRPVDEATIEERSVDKHAAGTRACHASPRESPFFFRGAQIRHRRYRESFAVSPAIRSKPETE